MNSEGRMKEIVKKGYKRCPVCTLLQENKDIRCKRCKYEFNKIHKKSEFKFDNPNLV